MTKSLTVLVVDDDQRNRNLLEAYLLADGCRVQLAASGTAALEWLGDAIPDVVLCDLMMPGMDGFDVMRRLRAEERTRELPVIMVTAVDDPGSRARLAAFGATEFVLKPVDRWSLQSAIQRVLGRRGGMQ